MAHTTRTFAAAVLDRRIREAAAHLGSSTDEVRLARAILEVHATDDVVVAFGAAARLTLLPSQVRRLYSNGYGTYDLVNEAVAAAAA
ncbi:hypothetical protein SEA_ALANGRANT_20 [Mycobacterium phage AlanGrant]|uniref:Uncharacterized protein n=1 Tax=Mycobacterium phage AlanGrant TaxID=1647307 RepID=A0A0F6WEA2_9CAUD|nr:hypothetical protein SEA_ALANGRANT_20 [Mycobacterium phage AlanGrant]